MQMRLAANHLGQTGQGETVGFHTMVYSQICDLKVKERAQRSSTGHRFIHNFSDCIRGSTDTICMLSGGGNVWLIPSWQVARIEYFYHAAELCFRNYPVHCEQMLSTLATPAPGYCYHYSCLREISARITEQVEHLKAHVLLWKLPCLTIQEALRQSQSHHQRL